MKSQNIPRTAGCTLLTLAVMSSLYLWVTGGRLTVVTDLPQDYTSARALLHGDDPYESLFTLQPRHGLDPPPPEVMVRSNPHPPVAILLTIPYARLDFDTALRAVQWTQLLLLACSWTICYRLFEPKVSPWWWAFLGGLLGIWAPVRQGIAWGQPVGLLSFATIGLWFLARRERPFLFGLMLAAAVLIRPFTALHVIQACGWDRKQQLWGCAGGILGCTASFAVVGITPWEWYRLAQDAAGYVPWCGSLPGVLDLGAKGGQLLYAATAVLLAVFRYRGLSTDATAAIAATTAMIVYPLAWYYYDPSLIPVAGWVAARCTHSRNRLAAWSLAAYFTLRSLPNLVKSGGGEAATDVLADIQGWLQVLARLLLLAAVVAVSRRRETVSENAPS
jgi:hypothetical protein